MSVAIEMPLGRAEVIDALEAMTDEAGRTALIDIDEIVNVLYDDWRVLEQPAARVGSTVFASEVPSLEALARAFDLLLEGLGDVPTATYLNDPRWPEVVARAQDVLAAVQVNERLPVRRPDVRARVERLVAGLVDGGPEEHFADDLGALFRPPRELADAVEAVGDVLHASEIPAVAGLGEALAPLHDELGDAPDSTYRADPRWPAAAGRAQEVLGRFRTNTPS